MKETIYKWEQKLGLLKIKRCTEAEEQTIKQVMDSGSSLPVGIHKGRGGRFYKYDSQIHTTEEKQLIVQYESLYLMRRVVLILSLLLCIAILVIACLAILVLK